MVVLATLAIVAMVSTTAVGLLNSAQAPGGVEGAAQKPPDAPGVAALGAAPQGMTYTDLGEQCDLSECFRPIAVTADGLDSEETIDAVYTHLIDEGWGRLLPEGRTDPDEVPFSESALSDGAVLVQASVQPYTTDSTAGLLLAHTVPPSPAS
ncbi:hypothetical protein EV190_101605 [Actinorugispora endophytica]|uniref:LytR cell envelope-related transcriptional attenuator n=2 Tax=Actinorugispora endophytica TaxID=1605990 RepID=A0A4V3D997_9ACTN|nr:hypothetical protein EV190_101605 [Actinorugispora endophytica]